MQTCSHMLSVKFEACRRDDRKQKKAARHNTSERADASNCKTFNVALQAHTKTCARAVAGRMCSTSGSLPNSKSALCRPVPLPSLHASSHKFIDNSGKSRNTHSTHCTHAHTHTDKYPLFEESSRHLPTRSRLTSNLQVSGRPHLLSSSFLSMR